MKINISHTSIQDMDTNERTFRYPIRTCREFTIIFLILGVIIFLTTRQYIYCDNNITELKKGILDCNITVLNKTSCSTFMKQNKTIYSLLLCPKNNSCSEYLTSCINSYDNLNHQCSSFHGILRTKDVAVYEYKLNLYCGIVWILIAIICIFLILIVSFVSIIVCIDYSDRKYRYSKLKTPHERKLV